MILGERINEAYMERPQSDLMLYYPWHNTLCHFF